MTFGRRRNTAGVADPAPAGRSQATRVLVTLAAATLVLVGLHLVGQIVSTLAMAMIFTVCAYPLRAWLRRRRVPNAVSTVLVVLIVWAVLVGLAVVALYALAQFSHLVMTYGGAIKDAQAQFTEWLIAIGVDDSQIAAFLGGLNPATIASFIFGLLGGILDFGTALVFLFTLVLLLAVDISSLRVLAASIQASRPNLLLALQRFSSSVRRYLSMTTLFGAIIAFLDGVALVALGVPSPLLWVALAFITNFVPNVGFIVGLVPPVLIALLSEGWQTALLLLAIYIVVTIAVQSFVQPLLVSRSVGLGQTVSFLSLILWAIVLGPIGAILATPMTLFARAVLVDSDPEARWVRPLLGDFSDLA